MNSGCNDYTITRLYLYGEASEMFEHNFMNNTFFRLVNEYKVILLNVYLA